MASTFNSLLNLLSKESEDDSQVKVYSPDQLFWGSNIPYTIRTGLPMLELCMGAPGWPAGRITELYSFEGCGKTTLSLHAIANCQKMGGAGIFIDSEKTFDKLRAKNIGIDVDNNFSVVETSTVEGGFRTIKRTCEALKKTKMDSPFVIVYDSVTGTQNEYDLEQEIGQEQRIGNEAKIIRQSIRAIASLVSDCKVVLLLINHAIASNIGGYGKKSQASGGHAIKLWASSRVELKNLGKIKDDDDKRLGQKVEIFVEKNKLSGVSLDKFQCELLNDGGFNTAENLLEAMVRIGMIKRPKGARKCTYINEEEEIEFITGEWINFANATWGSINNAYTAFINYGVESNNIRSYGNV